MFSLFGIHWPSEKQKNILPSLRTRWRKFSEWIFTEEKLKSHKIIREYLIRHYLLLRQKLDKYEQILVDVGMWVDSTNYIRSEIIFM